MSVFSVRFRSRSGSISRGSARLLSSIIIIIIIGARYGRGDDDAGGGVLPSRLNNRDSFVDSVK